MATEKKTVIIDTGNIFQFGIIQRKGLNDVNIEVIDGMESLLNCYTNQIAKWNQFELNGENIQYLRCDNYSLENHDRNKLKLTVKLFLYADSENASENYKEKLIDEFINSLSKLLNFKQIDNLILSIQTDNIEQVLPELKSYWKLIEKFVLNEKIQQLGTSDLNYQQLYDLYNFTEKIKPTSTQINLQTCCDIPKDLSTFSKENSIQLLAHNDPINDFVPIEHFERFFKNKNISCPMKADIKTMKRKWIARYTFVLPGQGVVLAKGYMLSLMI